MPTWRETAPAGARKNKGLPPPCPSGKSAERNPFLPTKTRQRVPLLVLSKTSPPAGPVVMFLQKKSRSSLRPGQRPQHMAAGGCTYMLKSGEQPDAVGSSAKSSAASASRSAIHSTIYAAFFARLCALPDPHFMAFALLSLWDLCPSLCPYYTMSKFAMVNEI